MSSGGTANPSAHNVSVMNHSIAGIAVKGAQRGGKPVAGGQSVSNQSTGRGGNFPRIGRVLSTVETEWFGGQKMIRLLRVPVSVHSTVPGMTYRPVRLNEMKHSRSESRMRKVLQKADLFLIANAVKAVGKTRPSGGKTRRGLWGDYSQIVHGCRVFHGGERRISVHVHVGN